MTAIADRLEKARSLARVVDGLLTTRFSEDYPGEFTPTLQRLRREVLRSLAGLYRGNILARSGISALEEDIAVFAVIRAAATVQEYRCEDYSFRVAEPDQVIAEHLDTASYYSRPGDYE